MKQRLLISVLGLATLSWLGSGLAACSSDDPAPTPTPTAGSSGSGTSGSAGTAGMSTAGSAGMATAGSAGMATAGSAGSGTAGTGGAPAANCNMIYSDCINDPDCNKLLECKALRCSDTECIGLAPAAASKAIAVRTSCTGAGKVCETECAASTDPPDAACMDLANHTFMGLNGCDKVDTLTACGKCLCAATGMLTLPPSSQPTPIRRSLNGG
jgi:hypothetical protein